jgi:hypothetical protein
VEASAGSEGDTGRNADSEELPDVAAVVGDSSNPRVLLRLPEWAVPFNPMALKIASSEPHVIRPSAITAQAEGTNQVALALSPSAPGYSRIRVTLRDLSDGLFQHRYSFHYAASARGREGGIWHTEASDASAVVAIAPDLILVGDDEDEVLRLYPRNRGGPPLARFDMTPLLGLTDLHHNGRPKEVDIEAVTRVGDVAYWVGSQSHDREGMPAINRGRIFATQLSGSGADLRVRFLGRYDYILQDLIAWDHENQHGLGKDHFGLVASTASGLSSKAPGGEGFVIEGVCACPGDPGTAWLGFRAPLVPPDARWKALIVPVTNFYSLAVSGAAQGSTRFGPPILLDLGGRGIRDLAAAGSNVLIVAGPPGHESPDLPRDFRLFTWDGNPVHAPECRGADLGGLRPEAIVDLPPLPWTPGSDVDLVSDSGTTELYDDGVPAKLAKSASFKKFRSDRVRLGDVIPTGTMPSVPPPPSP